MKTYRISNEIEMVEIQAESTATFHVYPKVVELYPNFVWENIEITEI